MIQTSDIAGMNRLAIDATIGIIGVVEDLHRAVLNNVLPGTPANRLIVGATALTYDAVRTVTGLVGGCLDAMLAPLHAADMGRISPPAREATLAVINGIVGDHLAATENPLAIRMNLRREGRVLRLHRTALTEDIPHAGPKVLVMVHGLCMNDLQWTRGGHNHGEALAKELGWTTVYLHFNSGLHVSTNGRAFASLLEMLVDEWPVPVRELAIIGHSYGGLLARSAHHYGTSGGYGWTKKLRRLVFLGTPHHGSALERHGNSVNVLLGLTSYSAPFIRIARIRSAGITDLRYGYVLDEDWEGHDRFHHAGDRRRPLPLPKWVGCFAIAANKGRIAGGAGAHLGDGLVNVDSALGRHENAGLALSFSEAAQWIAHGVGHWDLLSDMAVYDRIRTWFVISTKSQHRRCARGDSELASDRRNHRKTLP